MRWTLRKLDALLGTVLAAVAGLCLAQLPAFIQQYLQRLGGHVDEAQLSLSRVSTDAVLQTLNAPARQTLAVALEQRLGELESGRQAITAASATARPFVFVRELDVDIAMATLRAFEPALPLSSAGLVYGVVGMVAGWLIYELFKTPAAVTARRRRKGQAAARIEPS